MKVFIDPGHGGNDNGAAYGEKFDYLEEDDLNLIIAFLLRYGLLLSGHQVMMSRKMDKEVSLKARTDMANAWGADIYVSIHADAWHQQTASGISTHIHPAAGGRTQALGTSVHGVLITWFPKHTNRGLTRSNFHVLRESKMPAILIECEFISNPSTRRFLKEPENQLRLADAIRVGIQEYSAGHMQEEAR